jgi:adenylate kinase family enzyme
VGKSTISGILAKRLGARHVSIDQILEENRLDQADKKEGRIPLKNFIQANEMIIDDVRKNLNRGKIILFDGCFYHEEQLKDLIEKLSRYKGFVFNLKASLKECINRDSNRKRVYGKDAATAVYGMIKDYGIGEDINTENRDEDDVAEEIIEKLK